MLHRHTLVGCLGMLLLIVAAAHAADVNRSRVTFVKNHVGAGRDQLRVATVISVVNQSAQTCQVQVAWVANTGTVSVDGRTRFVAIPASGSAQFCSRPLPLAIASCTTQTGAGDIFT